MDTTDGRLGRYLLGQLTPDEEEAIELEYLAGDEAMSLVEEAEDDLVDDYAAGRLSPQDLRRFEERLLPRPGMADRVAFARALAAQRPPRPRALARPWLAWAAALLLAALSTGLGSALHRQQRAAAEADAAARERVAALERKVGEQQALLAAVPRPGDAPRVVELRDGVSRGDGGRRNEIAVPGDGWILLRLRLDEHLYPSYAARLETMEGRRLESPPAVRREAPVSVDLMVPGPLLQPGDYMVMLEGVAGATREPIGGFHLHVRAR